MFNISLYNLRVLSVLIQVGLIVILSLDGYLVDNLMILIGTNEALEENTVNAAIAWWGIGASLVISQCMKIVSLALGLHLNHIRLMKIAATLDALNVALFGAMLGVLLFIGNESLAFQASGQPKGSLRDPVFPFILRYSFGIAFSFMSSWTTYLLVSKLRRMMKQQTN